MQLPNFPDFKLIKEVDEASIHAFSTLLAPYSDYIFSNIWSWNLDGSFRVSQLNGNLVLYSRDTRSKDFLISLHGINKVNESLREIFSYIENTPASQTLALIPEETAELVDISEFEVLEDRDSFDYVYSTKELMLLDGREYKSKRHLVNQFTKAHPNYEVQHKKLTPPVKLELLQFMSAENRKRSQLGYAPFVEYEMAALEHFFLLPDNPNMIASILYMDGILTGFTIDEFIFKQYALSHFFKVNSEYKGVYDTLNRHVAEMLNHAGVEYWNWVEDLGLEGLRQAKLSYRPAHFLKKYTISKL